MSEISFFHIGVKPNATEFVIQSVRKFHPDDPYYLCNDGDITLIDMANKYNCDYTHYIERLGGPKQPFGYDKRTIINFLQRFKLACDLSLASGVEHIMMLEDDVILVNRVTVDPNWEMACHNIGPVGNEIPIIDIIEKFSGKRPLTTQYGGGGGSIFNAKTFSNNFERVIKFFDEQSEYIMYNLYPTFGWIDCFMVIYFMLCGKDYQRNPHLIDTNNHTPGFDYETFLNNLSPEIQIVNNYKKYYYE